MLTKNISQQSIDLTSLVELGNGFLQFAEWRVKIGSSVEAAKAEIEYFKKILRYHAKSPEVFKKHFEYARHEVRPDNYKEFDQVVECMRETLFKEMFPEEKWEVSEVVKDISSLSSNSKLVTDSTTHVNPKRIMPEFKRCESKSDAYVHAYGDGFAQYVLMREQEFLMRQKEAKLYFSTSGGINVGDMKRYLLDAIDHPQIFAIHARLIYRVSEELIEPMRKTLLKERLLSELRSPEDSKEEISPLPTPEVLHDGDGFAQYVEMRKKNQLSVNVMGMKRSLQDTEKELNKELEKEIAWQKYITPLSEKFGIFHRNKIKSCAKENLRVLLKQDLNFYNKAT